MKLFLPLLFIALPLYGLLICFGLQAQTTENLALNQPAYASSAHTALPEKAFDGDLSTRWESDYSDPENWITVQSVTGNPSLDNDFTDLNANGRYVHVYATACGNVSEPTLYGNGAPLLNSKTRDLQ